MQRTREVIAGVLIVSIFVSGMGVVGAQSPGAPSTDTMAAGLIDGEALAESRRTGGNLGAGLAVGVLTGLIGTGIGYFVVGPDPLSPEALQRAAARSADYQLGLKTGWERKTRAKKRNAFLAGGLLGTAAFFAIYASAQGGE